VRRWKEKKKIGRRRGGRKEGQEDWIGKKGRRKNGNIEEVEGEGRKWEREWGRRKENGKKDGRGVTKILLFSLNLPPQPKTDNKDAFVHASLELLMS